MFFKKKWRELTQAISDTKDIAAYCNYVLSDYDDIMFDAAEAGSFVTIHKASEDGKINKEIIDKGMLVSCGFKSEKIFQGQKTDKIIEHHVVISDILSKEEKLYHVGKEYYKTLGSDVYLVARFHKLSEKDVIYALSRRN
jgi:hypothetical protein